MFLPKIKNDNLIWQTVGDALTWNENFGCFKFYLCHQFQSWLHMHVKVNIILSIYLKWIWYVCAIMMNIYTYLGMEFGNLEIFTRKMNGYWEFGVMVSESEHKFIYGTPIDTL
jgi:hypothetical protein